MLETSVMQRLAFIKYLYTTALEQSKQPEPLGAAALLTSHDSVELYLQLASEQLDAGAKNPGFMDYWELFETKLPNGLTQKESMRRLNKSRVALKHHGTLPSKIDIEGSRSSVTNFFQENTPLIFGIEFDSVSMVNLISCKEVREIMIKASELSEQGNYSDAVNEIAVAFSDLIDDYEKRKLSRFGRSPFFFGQSLTFESSFFMKIEDQKIARFVDKVKESIESMQQAMKIVSLGLDYRRYTKFRMLTPFVTKTMGGRFITERSEEPQISKEDARYCYDFVISSAIRLQEFDFEVEE